MGEYIHVLVTTPKRTLTMELSPEQAGTLVNELTNWTGPGDPPPVARSLFNALCAIRDHRSAGV